MTVDKRLDREKRCVASAAAMAKVPRGGARRGEERD
jgi:hypothetical protein